jgi:ligand-binding sensor domain-containing protein
MEWGLYNEDVAAIYLDSNRACFGSLNYYGGESALTLLDRRADKWKYYESRYIEGFGSSDVSRIVGDPNGRYLWLATDQGVVRFDTRDESFQTYDEHNGLSDTDILSLCLDGDIVWVGTEFGVNGIYVPNDSVFDATTDLIHGVKVYDIDVTDDVVWLGTDFGLYRLNKPTPVWKRFSYADSPLEGVVTALTHDAEYVYVASDRGIVMIDRQGTKPIQTFDSPSVIPYNQIYDLAVTDTILWAATSAGLLRFVPSTHERRTFGRADGMLDDIVESIVVDGDYLWLATVHGVNRFLWNNPLRID